MQRTTTSPGTSKTTDRSCDLFLGLRILALGGGALRLRWRCRPRWRRRLSRGRSRSRRHLRTQSNACSGTPLRGVGLSASVRGAGAARKRYERHRQQQKSRAWCHRRPLIASIAAAAIEALPRSYKYAKCSAELTTWPVGLSPMKCREGALRGIGGQLPFGRPSSTCRGKQHGALGVSWPVQAGARGCHLPSEEKRRPPVT